MDIAWERGHPGRVAGGPPALPGASHTFAVLVFSQAL